MKDRSKKLRLHRETLRVMTGHELARAAGGIERFTAGINIGGHDMKPKTNAWSGTDPAATCA